MTQLEYLEKAVQLKKENPSMEIKILACRDEIEGEYPWTAHGIRSVSVECWYDTGDEILIDIEDIMEYQQNTLLMTDKEIEGYQVEWVIAIKTGAV